jgi:V/A-type H+-transporting ATPase subunit D
LLDRLRSGRLAASLLDRKVKILRAEQERLRTHAEQSRARWLDRAREADLWGQRAALLGGQREFLRGTPAEGAEVDVEWGSIMGARYPVAATVRLPMQADRGAGTAALIQADAAYRGAVEAAAAHAVASAAVRTVEAELEATGRRLRAISDRWLPRLEGWLATGLNVRCGLRSSVSIVNHPPHTVTSLRSTITRTRTVRGGRKSKPRAGPSTQDGGKPPVS